MRASLLCLFLLVFALIISICEGNSNHPDCPVCEESEKCCFLGDSRQCVGEEYICAEYFPYAACHRVRCPLLQEGTKLCYLTSDRYYFCPNGAHCSDIGCSDGSEMLYDFFFAPNSSEDKVWFVRAMLAAAIVATTTLILFRKMETMQKRHITLTWVHIICYIIYARYCEGAQITDPCPNRQLSCTAGIMLPILIKIAQLYYYVRLWKVEQSKREIIQQFKSNNQNITISDLIYKPSQWESFVMGPYYAPVIVILYVSHILVLITFGTDVSLFERRPCLSITHPVLSIYSYVQSIFLTLLQFIMVYIYRRELTPFTRSTEQIADALSKTFMIIAQVFFFIVYHLILNRGVNLADNSKEMDRLPMFLGHVLLAAMIVSDLMIAIVYPVLYDLILINKHVTVNNEIRKRWSNEGEDPLIQGSLMIYAQEEYAMDIIIIWVVLEKLSHESIKQQTYATILYQLSSSHELGIENLLGKKYKAIDLQTEETCARAYDHFLTNHLLPLYARMIRRIEYDVLLSKRLALAPYVFDDE